MKYRNIQFHLQWYFECSNSKIISSHTIYFCVIVFAKWWYSIQTLTRVKYVYAIISCTFHFDIIKVRHAEPKTYSYIYLAEKFVASVSSFNSKILNGHRNSLLFHNPAYHSLKDKGVSKVQIWK